MSYVSILTWLIAQEDFIEFSCCEAYMNSCGSEQDPVVGFSSEHVYEPLIFFVGGVFKGLSTH
jgi:hypothetical protein